MTRHLSPYKMANICAAMTCSNQFLPFKWKYQHFSFHALAAHYKPIRLTL